MNIRGQNCEPEKKPLGQGNLIRSKNNEFGYLIQDQLHVLVGWEENWSTGEFQIAPIPMSRISLKDWERVDDPILLLQFKYTTAHNEINNIEEALKPHHDKLERLKSVRSSIFDAINSVRVDLGEPKLSAPYEE